MRTRTVTERELLQKLDEGLQSLVHLCSIYDDGYDPIAFEMSSIMKRILTENQVAIRMRGELRLTSPAPTRNEREMLNSMHKLIAAEVSGQPPELRFVPHYKCKLVDEKSLPFRDWWNRDIIYRASAAKVGTPPGFIPVNGTPEVPFEERLTFTRRSLIELLRNKAAAHQGAELPEILDQIEHPLDFGAIRVETPSGRFSILDGSLIVVRKPLAAMIRQICHELLASYGRRTTPTP